MDPGSNPGQGCTVLTNYSTTSNLLCIVPSSRFDVQNSTGALSMYLIAICISYLASQVKRITWVCDRFKIKASSGR